MSDIFKAGDLIRRKDNPIMQYVITHARNGIYKVKPITFLPQGGGCYSIDDRRQHAIIIINGDAENLLPVQIHRILPNGNGWELIPQNNKREV